MMITRADPEHPHLPRPPASPSDAVAETPLAFADRWRCQYYGMYGSQYPERVVCNRDEKAIGTSDSEGTCLILGRPVLSSLILFFEACKWSSSFCTRSLIA